jgi:hypothetical protein
VRLEDHLIVGAVGCQVALAEGSGGNHRWTRLVPDRGSTARRGPIRLNSAQEGFKAGGEALVAVAVPGVNAARGQGREAVGGQGTEKARSCSVSWAFLPARYLPSNRALGAWVNGAQVDLVSRRAGFE